LKRLIFTGFLFFLALARQTAYAQGLLGTILGTVSDSSGAAVGDVNVTVKNQATNLQVGGKTQSNELYQIPNLPIGTYSVTFQKPGFEIENHPHILVQAERSATVNGSLHVGCGQHYRGSEGHPAAE
jgi:hypothetical protein